MMNTQTQTYIPLPFARYLGLTAAVLLISLVGIYWRPFDQLSALWPTNALLLGLLLRNPRLATPAGWGAAAAGYMLADLLTGNSWSMAIWLNLTNLLSVAIALALCRPLIKARLDLLATGSLPRLLLAILLAALAAGTAGGLSLWLLQGASFWLEGPTWAVSELLAYIVALPCVLSAPKLRDWRWRERRAFASSDLLRNGMPAVCLLAAVLAGVFIGGPGALAFPVVALLACALSYGMFATCMLTLAFSLWTLLGTTSGNILPLFDIYDPHALLSMRLGVASIALAPVVVASAMAARESSMAAMRYLAEHDALTGLLNRRTFHERAEQQLARLAQQGKSAGILLMDIDHFKAINDNYGHAVGDTVLRITAERLRASLRSEDLCGRLGGEEFAVLVPGCNQELLERIALRIHKAVRAEISQYEHVPALSITLSTGATLNEGASIRLEQVLKQADDALYAAKRGGRDQTRFV